MATSRNVIVGAAQIFLSVGTTKDGTAAEPLPTWSAGVSAKTTLAGLTSDWRDVGYTTDGLEVMYEPQYGEVVVDQALDAVLLFKQSMKVSLRTTMSEATLENLHLAFNQNTGLTRTDADNATLEIQGGVLGEYPPERSLIAVGGAPRATVDPAKSTERIYYTARVMNVESSTHSLRRNEETKFAVNFRLLPLASTSNAYGRIIDRSY
jgi:hypothetical protein